MRVGLSPTYPLGGTGAWKESCFPFMASKHERPLAGAEDGHATKRIRPEALPGPQESGGGLRVELNPADCDLGILPRFL